MKIIPSILDDQHDEIAAQIDNFSQFDEVETVQIDIVDGFYEDDLTITPSDLLEMDFVGLNLDLHLIVNEPIDFVHELIDIKDQLAVNAVIAQVEHMSSQQHFLDEVRARGWKAGLAIDLHTPLEAIDDESWEKLQIIQVMGAKAGALNQKMSFGQLGLVNEIKQKLSQVDLPIEIYFEGGVSQENIASLAAAGVGAAVIDGSSLQAGSLAENLSELDRLVGQTN